MPVFNLLAATDFATIWLFHFSIPFHGFLPFGAPIVLEEWVFHAEVLLTVMSGNHVVVLERRAG